MNVEKLRRLQTQVRIGGKGTPRRKKKVMHQTATTDDKKLQSSLKKLSVSTIPGIEEVNIIKDDLTVIHFNNPKAQASLSANTFAVTGHGETKKIVELLPEILPQLGQETVVQLRMFANSMTGTKKTGGAASGADASAAANMLYSVVEEDDVPMLVSDFDEVAKLEAAKTTTVTGTANSEQPASESDKDQNTVHNNGEILETVAVLPALSEEISHTKILEEADKKVIELQPLETSNLNIKLAAESEQKHSNLNTVNSEEENKKQQPNLKKENTNKIDQQKVVKESRKLNEPQKKNENKTQQKSEPLKQKTKLEQNTQKGLKENKKSDDAVANTVNSKAEERIKDGKTEEKAQETVGKSKKPLKQQQKPLQRKEVKSAESPEKQQKQLEQNQELNQLQKQVVVIEKKEKQQQSEQSDAEDLQTNTNTKKLDSQVPKVQNKQQQQQIGQQQIQKPKPAQQQQEKGDQQIKQKNKSGQQKQQNLNLQSKTDIEQGLKKTEAHQPTSKQPTAKQQEKGPTSQLKAPEERLTDMQLELKDVSLAEQATATVGNQNKSENFADTQVKGLQQTKKVRAVPADDVANDIKQNPEAQTLPNEKQQDEEVEEKCQQDISASKDDQVVIAPERQTESGITIADVSIRTVALQSLKSTEKVLGLVNEIAKEFTAGDLKERNEPKKEVSVKAQLPVESTAMAESAKDTSEQTTLNTGSTNTVVIPVADLQDIQLGKVTNLNVVDNIASAVGDLTRKAKGEPVMNNEKPANEGNENIADNSSNTEQNQREAKENKDINITEVQLSKEPTLSQILQSQTTPSPTPQKTILEPLDKLPSTGEVGQIPSAAILPLTSLVTTENLLGDEGKPKEHISIATDLLPKQLSIAEVLQSQPPHVAIETTPLPKTPLADGVKDTQIVESVDKNDIKNMKSDSNVLLSTEASKSIDLSQANLVKVTTPELVPALPENKTAKQQNAEKKSSTATVSPKQKASPPKQTPCTKGLQETPKQQAKASTGSEPPKASTPDDVKLKLATKPLPGQQQQTQSKGKPKPPPNKSATATPTTPTKISPEKSLAAQKSTASNTKLSNESASKKTTPPQKQQQADATGKSKQTQGVGAKAVRPGGGNASAATGGAKKANTPPAKGSMNTGAKQQEVGSQDKKIARLAVAEQPEVTTAPTSQQPAAPATENSATSNQSSSPTKK